MKNKVQRLHKNDDNVFNRFADQVIAGIEEMQALPVLNGIFIDATLASGSNVVIHTLGRVPFGWIVCQSNAGVHVYQESLTSTHLTLQAGGAVTVKLWVF